MNTLIKSIFFLFLTLLSISLFSQETLRGRIYGKEPHGDHHHEIFLAGANVVWEGTTSGVATDENGGFNLRITQNLPHAVVVSFMGYQSDTVMIEAGQSRIDVVLEPSRQLDEVVVASRRPGAHVSSMEPILTNVITENELQRAACCNLSEAFETNASVDVSFTDAVSGAQQIQLLGLAGTYGQILTENTPTIRGLGQPYGLGFIPGPWMESIHISKGAGSVVNGYESITGQINVELKKPESSDMLFYNFYGNDFGRLESSLNLATRLNEQWSTMVLAHAEILENQFDHNGDSFLDHPLMRKYNIVNRYRYDRPGVMESQFGFRVMQENRRGGQLSFFENGADIGSPNYYGFGVKTDRYEAFARTGFFLPGQPDGSIGTQLSFIHHNHDSQYGWNEYLGRQNTLYANIIYENSIARNPDHRINAGFSFLFDDYKENLTASDGESNFDRIESVPGVFTQYTFQRHEKFTGILGVRADFHNLHGTFFSPRLHIRAGLTPNTILRASAGKGYRVPNMLAENTGLLVSNRQLVFVEEINPEEAWNYGGSITQSFDIFGRDASFALEYYRTDFVNQLIVDVDTDYRFARFYNLNGKSYANNSQAELKFEPALFFEVTAAIRFIDVKTTINDELVKKPFVNNYKGLLSGSWASRNNNWQVDLTGQFNGKSRIPDTSMLPGHYQMPAESPAYLIMHGQITRRWQNFDLYVGGENLTNYKQHNPIIGASNPFGENLFDASMIWGPIMGRMFYLGLRYSIQ
ncbi:MAG: TonB-dependent receptor [Bacteroidales bacterium]|nr:TonB-dependent receptor [Bacteroidales bacterium]